MCTINSRGVTSRVIWSPGFTYSVIYVYGQLSYLGSLVGSFILGVGFRVSGGHPRFGLQGGAWLLRVQVLIGFRV